MRLVFLHGPAASGKLTTARELGVQLGYPVFHNHLVVDLLTALFPFGSPGFVRLREQMWLAVFEEAALAGRSLVFTFAPEPTVRAGFAERTRTVVERHGGEVCFVELVVSAEEQLRRIDDPSRTEFHKLTDPAVLHRIRQTEGPPVDSPPADLTLDTDVSSPSRSATRIIGHFGLRPQPAEPRYPEL